MTSSSLLSSRLALGHRWTFVGGKGGVGKTTVAAALALELADAGEQVLVISVDPAHSLGDALGVALGPEPAPVAGIPGLAAIEVDAEYERRRFVEEHGAALATLIERGTYLDPADLDGVDELGVPGMDEVVALLRLGRAEREFAGRLVIDTAPTGHTLRLLELPRLALRWIEALEAMDAKRQAVATALAGAPQRDAATDLLAWLRSEVNRVESLLHDPDLTRFVLVTTPEPVVRAETLRYLDELQDRGIAAGGIVVNRFQGPVPADPGGDGPPLLISPVHPRPILGLAGLRSFSAAVAMAAGPTAPALSVASEAGSSAAGGIVVGDPWVPPLDRRLYFVGGKGGVGKSTASAALALRLVTAGRGPVLLLSVDPAGSLEAILETGASDPRSLPHGGGAGGGREDTGDPVPSDPPSSSHEADPAHAAAAGHLPAAQEGFRVQGHPSIPDGRAAPGIHDTSVPPPVIDRSAAGEVNPTGGGSGAAGGSARPVPGIHDLFMKQLDADAAWASFRDRYARELADWFAEMLPAGASAALDRTVLERLLDLAPAGIDELVALLEVIDSIEDREYDALVVDTAPTGHFLRLLEMPQLALQWCHAILRLLLKNRAAGPVSELGERVLRLSRSLREFMGMLRDDLETCFLAVALPEDLAIPETRRLLDGAARSGVRAGALLVNRALDGSGRPRPEAVERVEALLRIDPNLPAVAAPVLDLPPTGLGALYAFAGAWREISVAPGRGTSVSGISPDSSDAPATPSDSSDRI